MSRHTSYRGITIDMETMRRENEKVTALGNMKVNAKGDQLGRGGTIVKQADKIARENHLSQTSIVNTGLKGPVPTSPAVVEQKKDAPIKATVKKTIEKELPNGDIEVQNE